MFRILKKIQAGDRELQDRAEFFWCGLNKVLVVADGAGGRSGGAEAAEFVVNKIKERVASTNLAPQSLSHLLASLDREMVASGNLGETTCVVVILSGSGIAGTSVGDSGALIFSKGAIQNLTANQVRKPFVGTGAAVPVGFASGPLEGTLLVASDGLLKYTSQEKIADTLATIEFDGLGEKLISLVRYQSGALPDDVALLIARNA